MNVRVLLVVGLALVCGLSAMGLVRGLSKPGGPEVERVPVVFAAADVKAGEMILEAMLEVRQVPSEEVPEDAIRQVADAVDRAAMAPLDKGDLIRQKKLAEKGAGRGMASLIKPGMRAFTIQTPSFSSSLAGLLLPGNKVDVLMTATSPGGVDDEVGGASTATLLQNVEILAVHTTVNTPASNKIDPEQARSVTLLVTPDDAALLDLGQTKGTLHLSLRNPRDSEATRPKPATVANLPFPQAKPKPTPEPPKPPDPPAVVEAPEPVEADEVRLTLRTLRGTFAGEDTLTLVRPRTPGPKFGPMPALPGGSRFAGR